MYVEKIFLKNFRNYSDIEIHFSEGYNFITGKNGAGKTNILEALHVLSSLKSFRGSVDDSIVKFGENTYYCRGVIKENSDSVFEVGCECGGKRNVKRIKIDGYQIKNYSEYYGRFITVIVSPDDIQLVTGSPDKRRRFVDGVISKVDRSYLSDLVEFKKVLSSRNKVLKDLKEKNIYNYSHLDAWDEMYSRLASNIISKRIEFLDDFTMLFSSAYDKISDSELSPEIEYHNSIGLSLKDEIFYKLLDTRPRDIMIGSTGSGPQRDDYILKIGNDKPFSDFSSQGQKRTSVISLKCAELEYIEKKVKKKPSFL